MQYAASDGVPELAQPAGAVVHMFHGGLWGGWQYMVASRTNDTTLAFGYGGYQAPSDACLIRALVSLDEQPPSCTLPAPRS